MDEPVRVGLIGCGAIGAQHAAALAGLETARLVAVVDPDRPSAQRVASRYGVEVSGSSDALLARDDVDAVIVAAPTPAHRALTLAAARARRHVLVEKPAALTLAHLQEMQQACAAAGVVLLVGQTLRFAEVAQALHAARTAGDVGTPVFFRWAFATPRAWPGGWRGWQADPEQSGTMALHLGIHSLDLALWLLDSAPVRVYAQGADLIAPGLAAHDYLHACVRCENGAQALVEIHTGLRGRENLYQAVSLVGTRGQADWSVADDGLLLTEGGTRLLFTGYANALRAEIAHFADCCRGASAPLVTPTQARWALGTAIAVAASLACADAVPVPSGPGA